MMNSVKALVAGALISGLTPETFVPTSEWMGENLVVSTGPASGTKWDPSLTPYVSGIVDCLATDGPHNRVSVRKSSQVGLTEGGIGWVLSVVDQTPADILIVFPTLETVKDFNEEKLSPSIEQTKCIADNIQAAGTRSAKLSTALKKRFKGGTLGLTGANSAADLRSKSKRFVYADEIDEWPEDLNGQGDPMEMLDARQVSFHALGNWRKFETSTPTNKGSSRIDAAFEEGDQRYWFVKCPCCGAKQVLEFGGNDTKHGLKFNRTFPYQAHYVCKDNGCVIEHHHKRDMVLNGEWIATMPGPGRRPSFHIDALSSLLTTWDIIAEKWWGAQGNAKKLKAFRNLWLGLVWEERGDAPEWKGLYLRREDYPRGHVPARGYVLTGAVDVQKNGVYYEVVAWGRDGESWSIDVDFVPGDTSIVEGDCYRELEKLLAWNFPTAYGGTYQLSVLGIDGQYNAHTVRAWARGRPKVMVLRGDDGHLKPAVGTPVKNDIDYGGRKISNGALVWPVGTWPLKSQLYGQLRLEGRKDGAEQDPSGYCYFSEFHDEMYFRQLTAEYLKDVTRNGRTSRVWVPAFENHYHDVRIYNMAMREYMRLPQMTEEWWDEYILSLGATPNDPDEPDLLKRMREPAPVTAQAEQSAPEAGSNVNGEHNRSGSYLTYRPDFLK
jgi:phage terminase large subunit GpA-like protein